MDKMTEKIAQRYTNVSRQIKDKNPELEPEFIKIMNQTLNDFSGFAVRNKVRAADYLDQSASIYKSDNIYRD